MSEAKCHRNVAILSLLILKMSYELSKQNTKYSYNTRTQSTSLQGTLPHYVHYSTA